MKTGTLFFAAFTLVALLLAPAPHVVASSGRDSSSSASTQADSDGGVQITVEATYTSSDGAAGSSATATSSTATTTVLPVCGYRQSMSGAGMVEHLNRSNARVDAGDLGADPRAIPIGLR